MTESNGRYNEDELHAPDWLNEDFILKILQSNETDKDIKIKNLTITPGTSKNDHYASIMFRTKVDYTSSSNALKTKSMIVKTTPFIEGQKKEFLEQYSLFETEIKMYGNTLLKIEAILREHGDETKLCAKMLYSSLTPRKCIIFEDLCERGYTTIKDRYPSIEEAHRALTKLAKLHAVSYKLAQEGDISITEYKEGSFSDSKILDFPFLSDAIEFIKRLLAKYEDLAVYVPYYEKIEKKIFERVFATFNAYQNGERGDIFVLNHGDFHMKNMMILEKDGKLQDLLLVDYQISVFGSATIDVMYAFFMFFSPDMRLNKRDELVYFYFTNFTAMLSKMNFQGRIPTMIDFQTELLKNGHFELMLASSFLSFNYLFPDPETDLAKALEDAKCRQDAWERPDILAELRTMLPFYLHRGYFDF